MVQSPHCMKPLRSLTLLAAFLAVAGFRLTLAPGVSAAEPAEVVKIWPAGPPGTARERGPEHRLTGRPRPFYQITDVSEPTLSVVLPPRERRSGAAVLVLPGGGLQRLAIEHEGLEVATWLNDQNAAAFVLKYRVPERATVALQDVQRALSLIRSRAAEWGVDPGDIGVVGFSAGAELAAWLATHHRDRQYPALDAADAFSCRPAFAALIYSGGLVQGAGWQLKDPIAKSIDAETPPMFVAQAYDDSAENCLAVVAARKRAHRPAELHLYQEGGHGFGVRPTGAPVGGGKDRWREWLAWQGFLDDARTRAAARAVLDHTNGPLPALAATFPAASLPDAYRVQQRVVRARAAGAGAIAGYRALGTPGPDGAPAGAGVIFRSEIVRSGPTATLPVPAAGSPRLAPGWALVISVDFSFRLANDAQAHGAFASVAPFVQIDPQSAAGRGPLDLVAGNFSPGAFVLGAAQPLPETGDLAVVTPDWNSPGVSGAVPAVTPPTWSQLRALLNQITDQGYTLRAGDLILWPAAPEIPARPGPQVLEFGTVGKVEFALP